MKLRLQSFFKNKVFLFCLIIGVILIITYYYNKKQETEFFTDMSNNGEINAKLFGDPNIPDQDSGFIHICPDCEKSECKKKPKPCECRCHKAPEPVIVEVKPELEHSNCCNSCKLNKCYEKGEGNCNCDCHKKILNSLQKVSKEADEILEKNTKTCPPCPDKKCPSCPEPVCPACPENKECPKVCPSNCPDLSAYVLKTSIPPCPKQPDMRNYVHKADIPKYPDLSKYVLKTTIPPCNCPPCPPCKCPKCPAPSDIKVKANMMEIPKNGRFITDSQLDSIINERVKTLIKDGKLLNKFLDPNAISRMITNSEDKDKNSKSKFNSMIGSNMGKDSGSEEDGNNTSSLNYVDVNNQDSNVENYDNFGKPGHGLLSN